MNLLNNKKIIALILILTIFTLGYFIIVNKVSYAFVQSNDLDKLYEITINTIKECSIAYAKDNMDKFENDVLVLTVQDLIDNKLLVTNSEGEVTNPRNSEKSLNTNVITIRYNDGNFDVKVDN